MREKPASRKDFLARLGQALAALSFVGPLNRLRAAPLPSSGQDEVLSNNSGPQESLLFEQKYRKIWTWDDSRNGTHNINCWFQQNCLFHVYTRNGRVVREEQAGTYPATNQHVPDFNPRGCNKGCAYSEFMYSKPRVTTPLKRVGPRGGGRWQKVSWDEALSDIASNIIETIKKEGPESVVVDPGGNIVSYVLAYSMFRLFDLLDSTVLDVNTELGDDQQGAAVTYGEITSDRSADDYFYSDLIFIWGGNPAYTQIPNFHFLTEARYNGSKIIAISPDMNASAIHADEWVSLKPGTDSALACSMAQVIIEENLFHRPTLVEQTDLPFLVRVDNGKLLRQSDFRASGSEEILYRWDLIENELEEPGASTLELGKKQPALEGVFTVFIKGQPIQVRPVFEFLKKELEKFRPEKASKLCGVPAAVIRRLARELAAARAATNVCTSALSKYYHGDLLMRSQILVFVLCGHLGRKGAGFSAMSFLVPDGTMKLLDQLERIKELRWKYTKEKGAGFWKQYFKRGKKQAIYRLGMETFVDSGILANSTLFWNLHGGLLDVSGRTREWDLHLKRDLKSYLDETLKKKWQAFAPGQDQKPRVFFSWGGNSLRRVRSAGKILQKLWPDLRLVVALEMRISSTAAHADYILPVSGAYEKTTSMYANSNQAAPFLHTTAKVVPPVGMAKDEWEIACLLAKKIQELARSRGMKSFKTDRKKERRLDTIYEKLTDKYKPEEHAQITEDMVNDSTNLGRYAWDNMQSQGFVRFTGEGNNPANWGNASHMSPKETISPHTKHTRDKEPWFTLSGRIQFYIDHDWYLELGEELPTHKNPPLSGGAYPLTLTGGHARWSIHAQWRTDPVLLRLQRGEPVLMVSARDAADRNLKDDDRVRVKNDVGNFITRIKILCGVRPGQVIMYHGWENYQFEGWQSYRNVLASPLNPIEMVGDYPYIQPVMAVRQPGQSDRDTRVEIEKL